jgi:FKBP-type peptidyl-prolyl cis-trans isomerase FkpA
MKKISLVLFLFVTLLMACNKEEKCPYTQSTIVAPESEVTAVQQYLTTNNITGTTKHPNGFFYKIEAAGTGNTPDMCSQIGILYKGQLTNGTVFDETTNGQMRVFTLGELIPGWKLGIPLIKPGGGKIKLYLPPSLAYGPNDVKDQQGTVIIPGNSILIFEVEFVAMG